MEASLMCTGHHSVDPTVVINMQASVHVEPSLPMYLIKHQINGLHIGFALVPFKHL